MQVPAVSFDVNSNQPKKKKDKPKAETEDVVAPPVVNQSKHTVSASPAKRRKRNREESAPTQSKMTKPSTSTDEATNNQKDTQVSETNAQTPAQKKRKRKKKKPKNADPVISDERLKAFGINPKKYKYEYLKSLHEQNAANKGS